MAGINFTSLFADQVRKRLDSLTQLDTRTLVPRIGEYLLRSTQQRFTDQRAPDGTAWAKLKERYRKRKKYNADKVLTLRGYLRRSIRYQALGPDSAQVGTDHETAAIHQFGGEVAQLAQSRKVRFRTVAGRTLFAGRRHKKATERWVGRGAYTVKIPARPFVGLSADDEREIDHIISDWLARRGQR